MSPSGTLRGASLRDAPRSCSPSRAPQSSLKRCCAKLCCLIRIHWSCTDNIFGYSARRVSKASLRRLRRHEVFPKVAFALMCGKLPTRPSVMVFEEMVCRYGDVTHCSSKVKMSKQERLIEEGGSETKLEKIAANRVQSWFVMVADVAFVDCLRKLTYPKRARPCLCCVCCLSGACCMLSCVRFCGVLQQHVTMAPFRMFRCQHT